jgi:hypothetical protein
MILALGVKGLTQSILIMAIFYLCENAQNFHNFCSISVLFFSLKDNIHGHLPMNILADYVPYSITADAIRTIPGVHLAFMASAVTLQGT